MEILFRESGGTSAYIYVFRYTDDSLRYTNDSSYQIWHMCVEEAGKYLKIA